MRWTIVILCALCISSCSNSSTQNQNRDEARDTLNSQILLSSNEKMAQLLEHIQREIDPIENEYRSNDRAEILKKRIQNASDYDKPNLYMQYSIELLNAGRTNEALSILTRYLEILGMKYTDVDQQKKPLLELLGICFLRKGEQDNCQNLHSVESCIMPIQGTGVHQLKDGSNEAISIFQAILDKWPDDHEIKYLMNVAYMTLGKYPDEVPDEYLLVGLADPSQYSIPRFWDVAMDLGIAVNGLSGGCVLEDFNNDGYLDIMVSSWGFRDQLRLFFNDGQGGYEDVTKSAGLTGLTGGLNMIHGDYNNDGFEDVFVLRGAWKDKNGLIPNSLLRNNGNGTFTDVTESSGLLAFNPTQTAAWADFNLDGYLDLFVGNEKSQYVDAPYELYLNTGKDEFVEISGTIGLEIAGFIKGVTWGDVNDDLFPDLYVSYMGGDNDLFLNKGGTNANNWSFENISTTAGTSEPFYSFPCWFWDYNNDGLQDIFVSGYDPRYMNKVCLLYTSPSPRDA